MKVTKYPQSCLIIEHKGSRLIIDPGNFVAEKYKATDLGRIDGILITHEHSDHADINLIRNLIGDRKVDVVGNKSTADSLKTLVTKIVSDGESFTVAGIQVIAKELPHVAMIDGSMGPQNTGYLIDAVFFHPGDGIKISGLNARTAAVPIAGPDISFRDSVDYLKSVNCKIAIPVHYDYFISNPEQFAHIAKSILPDVKITVLNSGESTEI